MVTDGLKIGLLTDHVAVKDAAAINATIDTYKSTTI